MKSMRWVVVAGAVAAMGGTFLTSCSAIAPAQPATVGRVASGFIEAEEIIIAPEIAGQIVELLVDEGDAAQAGDVLLRLEDDILSALVDLAQAELDEAQARLAQAMAGARVEAIAKAEAQLALAQAARDAARQAWLDAQAIRDHPQDLDVQIAGAIAQVVVAQHKLEAALLQRDIAEKSWKDYGEGVARLADIPPAFRPPLPPDFYLIPYLWEQAQAAVNSAQAAHDGAQAALRHLLDQRSNPQEAQSRVDAAYARYQSAEAAAAQAQAALDGVRAGATPEQIAAAQAQVEVAQAALEAAQVQLGKATVRAPSGGLVVARGAQVGEMAAPGIPALILADLDRVTLVIYVPGQRLGEVALGQWVGVRVDAFADKVFPGVIVHIADRAEFTPRSVRVGEDRASLVYAVKIRLENSGHVLKPGMQAETQ